MTVKIAYFVQPVNVSVSVPSMFRVAYIYGECSLIVNGDEQLDTTEIDPAVRSVAVRYSVGCELRPRSTAQGSNCHPRLANKISLLVRPEDSGTVCRVIFPSSDLIDVL